jgi:hypothetical protein
MIIGQSFVQFESYIYLKITKFSNVNLFFFFWVISSSIVVRSNAEPKLINVIIVIVGLYYSKLSYSFSFKISTYLKYSQ